MDDIKKPKPVPVKTIRTIGKVSVVETTDKKGLHRFSLPSDKVIDGKVEAEVLEAAIPYGVPWADMPIKAITGDELQAAMYAADIWTAEDVNRHPQLVISVLESLLGVHLGSLVEYASQFK